MRKETAIMILSREPLFTKWKYLLKQHSPGKRGKIRPLIIILARLENNCNDKWVPLLCLFLIESIAHGVNVYSVYFKPINVDFVIQVKLLNECSMF